MKQRDVMDHVHNIAVNLAWGSSIGWFAVQVGGWEGIVCGVLLLSTLWMVIIMHSRLHFKMWAEFLDETGNKVDAAATDEEVMYTWSVYKAVSEAVYERR